ncbi:unnamed protein product [Cyclocybe aegerita]|uniref:Uncharacterized protein n=1 Tax=Cyclocybe aegerita TaxID=1973307 RepID=A0A8S0VW41_CYCAE|nr:unnamed protein product [Cyclocybe aegerita]
MLKRQRASSPPPSSSSVPLVTDNLVDLIDRGTKRRRTQPPVLDGGARGWAQDNCNDDEEDYYSDEGDKSYPRQTMTRGNSEYAVENSKLRELHTLHQHRLLFSSSNPSHYGPSHAHAPGVLTNTSFWPDNDQLLPHHHEPPHTARQMYAGEKGRPVESDYTFAKEAACVAGRYQGAWEKLSCLVGLHWANLQMTQIRDYPVQDVPPIS